MTASSRLLEAFAACLVILAAGCHPTPLPVPVPAEASEPPSAAAAPPPPPTSSARPAGSSPAPDVTARLCELIVTPLDARRETSPVKLGDVLATTPLVTVVVPVLDEPDCSGIGWRHLAFAPMDPQAPAGLIRAYGAQHLPAPVPERAPFYLLGGTFDAARVVDLKKVCVSFKSEVNARVDWVLPLHDRNEATAWQARLSTKVCGRENPACRGCERESGGAGCHRIEEDSCPGPAGRYSTCGYVRSCDAHCCN